MRKSNLVVRNITEVPSEIADAHHWFLTNWKKWDKFTQRFDEFIVQTKLIDNYSHIVIGSGARSRSDIIISGPRGSGSGATTLKNVAESQKSNFGGLQLQFCNFFCFLSIHYDLSAILRKCGI